MSITLTLFQRGCKEIYKVFQKVQALFLGIMLLHLSLLSWLFRREHLLALAFCGVCLIVSPRGFPFLSVGSGFLVIFFLLMFEGVQIFENNMLVTTFRGCLCLDLNAVLCDRFPQLLFLYTENPSLECIRLLNSLSTVQGCKSQVKHVSQKKYFSACTEGSRKKIVYVFTSYHISKLSLFTFSQTLVQNLEMNFQWFISLRHVFFECFFFFFSVQLCLSFPMLFLKRKQSLGMKICEVSPVQQCLSSEELGF